jgi:putative oxidoreductase
MKNILFNSGKHKPLPSIALLILRTTSGGILITHGWNKLTSFAQYAAAFPDPLHIGNKYSLIITIFAEFFCSALIILGLGTRFAAVPLIICMSVITFVIHSADPFSDKEMSLLFLSAFTTILILGAGSYSLDKAISGK